MWTKWGESRTNNIKIRPTFIVRAKENIYNEFSKLINAPPKWLLVHTKIERAQQFQFNCTAP